MERISPGVIAVLLGVVLCLGLVTPWVAGRYRRRGGIGLRDGLVAFATLVACAALATYTLMPLPAPWAMTCTSPAGVQLVPFAFVADTIARPGAIVQVLMNVALFLPVGFLVARGLRRRPVLVTTAVGAAVSLAIELTQLTAVWGIWPCAFRVFDVDDLIANTAGALVGALVSGAVVGPRRRRLAPNVPRAVTAARRLLGMACDAALLVLGGWVAAALATLVIAALRVHPYDRPSILLGTIGSVVPVVVFVIVAVLIGRTPGEWAVRLRPSTRPHVAQLIVRLLVGAAGWGLLRVLPNDLSWGAVALGAAAIVGVFVVPRHDGLACWLAGIRMVDDRAEHAGVGPRAAGRAGPWRFGTGAVLAIAVLAAAVPTVARPFPAFGAVDVYEPPAQFGVRFLEDLSSTIGSPLRGVAISRDFGADVLHGDLDLIWGVLGWMVFGMQY